MNIWIDAGPPVSWIREPKSEFTPEAINDALKQLNLLEDYERPGTVNTDAADLRAASDGFDSRELHEPAGE